MKLKTKIRIVALTILTIASSCNKNCNDCDPSMSKITSIQNETTDTLKYSFLYSSDANNQSLLIRDEFEINPNEKKELVDRGSFDVYQNIALERAPYNEGYDSVEVYKKDSLLNTFYTYNCEQTNNPLCEENYTLTRDEKDKNGNTVKEFLFIIE